MSIRAPYFSVALPTRNRGELAEQAVRYILNQTFRDFELIVADSDDTDDTRDRLKGINDPRLRYYGMRNVTGPDNFQFTVDQARGEYFVFLSDRIMLRPRALEVLYRHSEARRYPNIRYHCETFDDRQYPPKIWKPEYCDGNKLVTPDEVLTQFMGENDGAELNPLLPTPHLSAIHRGLLEKIRGPQSRPVFAPIVPDLWACFAQLSCCEGEMLNLGQILSVQLMRVGVGTQFLLKKESGTQFLREICKKGELEMEHVPIKSLLTNNMIYNDYLRARKLYGGRLLDYPLPWATYFVGVHRNFGDSMKIGVNMRPEYREWKQALAQQPVEVRKEVRRRLGSIKSYGRMEANRLMKKVRYALGINHLESRLKSLRPSKKKKSVPSYKTVAEYMANDAGQKSAEAALEKWLAMRALRSFLRSLLGRR
jgi:glycosyltransferase involved in cell wall biosynthesis